MVTIHAFPPRVFSQRQWKEGIQLFQLPGISNPKATAHGALDVYEL